MRCPYCLSPEIKVVDKRDDEENSIIRRRRECLKCEKRFTTYERVEAFELAVIKKDGRKEQFSREKLLSGVQKACEKRPIDEGRIERIVDDIESDLRNQEETEIPSRFIGELVMKKLKKMDKVAYIRFASVYREFGDLETFEKELRELKKMKIKR